MKEYKPYCYVIGWSKLDVWYYGSEYGHRSKIANPSNLWNSYFTSSKHVAKFRKEFGEPDIIKIRKIFQTADETIFWEYRVLRKLKVRRNSKWININEGKAPTGVAWTDEQKKRRSVKVAGPGNPMYGKKHSKKTKLLIAKNAVKIGAENGMYGKTHSDEAKSLMSENHIYTSGISHHFFGKKHSDESIQKMSESHNPKIFLYKHLTHGTINATMRQMISMYPELKISGLKALSSSRLKTYKGWSL